MVPLYLSKIKQYDKYTYLHCRRVSHISVLIGQSINLESTELIKLSEAALLHDLGKIRIPLSILNKPGKLITLERTLIEKHTDWGIDIISNHHKYKLQHVLQGINSHHERYDGSGYPSGLKGEAIPLYGRIIAIADTFDAMTSFRAYRSTISIDKANKQILQGAGTQFDPFIVMESINCNVKWLVGD